ncbi:MalM family protein [Vibrio maritimus]|uniref:MalM family protein n=1 Tax=Vibrio maritimus TaxID=990268 RepID=UPI001F41EC5D|nr:MalM family protein [Vibrio maritimus]
MIRKTILALALATIAGCASQVQDANNSKDEAGIAALNSQQGCCESLANVSFAPVSKPGAVEINLSTQSPKIELNSGRTFAEGIELPSALGEIKLTVYSIIDKQVFVPTVLVLDEKFQVLDVIGEDIIKHRESSILYKSGYLGEYAIPNRFSNGQKPVYLAVVTTKDALATSSEPMPPSEFALQSGSVSANDPYYSNLTITHSAIGKVTLELDYEPTGSRSETEAEKQTRQDAVAQHSEAVTTEKLTATQEQAFNQAIERAVEQGEFEKALRLSKEAESLGSKSAQQAFVDAMKKY